MARIELEESTVTWTAFEQPHRRDRWDYADVTFSFDREQYERALLAVA